MSSSVNPSTSGESVTFTATVGAVSPGTGFPTGTVTFLNGTSTLGTGNLSSGMTSFTTTSLTSSGSPYTITANYPGDTNFTTSTSNTVTQTVT